MREFTYFKVKIRNIDYEFKKKDTKMKNITNRIQSNVWTLALLVVLCGCKPLFCGKPKEKNQEKNQEKNPEKNQEHTADGMSSHTAKVELDEVANDYAPTMNSSAEMTDRYQYDDGPQNYSYDQTYI